MANPSPRLVKFVNQAADLIRDRSPALADCVWSQRFALPVQFDPEFQPLYDELSKPLQSEVIVASDAEDDGDDDSGSSSSGSSSFGSSSAAAAAAAAASSSSQPHGKRPIRRQQEHNATKRVQLASAGAGELHKTYIQLGSDKRTQGFFTEEAQLTARWAHLVRRFTTSSHVRQLEWPRAYQVALLSVCIFLEDIDESREAARKAHRAVFNPIRELMDLLQLVSWREAADVAEHSWLAPYMDRFVKHGPPSTGTYQTLREKVFGGGLSVMLLDFMHSMITHSDALIGFRLDARSLFATIEPVRWHVICDVIHSQRLLAIAERADIPLRDECAMLASALRALASMYCDSSNVRQLNSAARYWSALFSGNRAGANQALKHNLMLSDSSPERKQAMRILHNAERVGEQLATDFARQDPLREKLHLSVCATLENMTLYPSGLCNLLIAQGEWLVAARALALVNYARVKGGADGADEGLECRWFPEAAYANLYHTVLLASQLVGADFLQRVLIAPLRDRRCLLVMTCGAFMLFNRVQHFEYVKAHALHGAVRNRHADAYEMLYTLLHGNDAEFACGWVNTLHCLYSSQAMHSIGAAMPKSALITARYCEHHKLGSYFRRFVNLLSHLFRDAEEQITFMEEACADTPVQDRMIDSRNKEQPRWVGLVDAPTWRENHFLHPYYGLCAFLAPHLKVYAPSALIQMLRNTLREVGLVCNYYDGLHVQHITVQAMPKDDKDFYRHMDAWLTAKLCIADSYWTDLDPFTLSEQSHLFPSNAPPLPYNARTGEGYRPDDPHRYRRAWYDLCQETGYLSVPMRQQMFFCLHYRRHVSCVVIG